MVVVGGVRPRGGEEVSERRERRGEERKEGD